jgi:hypothetical protein
LIKPRLGGQGDPVAIVGLLSYFVSILTKGGVGVT